MRVAQVVPGSGGAFYCENCVRDLSLVRALIARGHDVVVAPLYLSLFVDREGVGPDAPLFFGGVNAWLQQASPLFRRTPRWVDRLFDAPWLLRQAARRAGSTRASTLGPMTLSMLRGEEGRQAKELARLAGWLGGRERPEVIHLSNALLLGLARRLRESTGAAVVCSLQDEAPWVDGLGEPWSRLCWEEMSRRAREVSAFTTPSPGYGERMMARLGAPPGRLHLVPLGVDPEGVEPSPLPTAPAVVGFMARMAPELGLERLAEAYLRLRRDGLLPSLRLHLTGGRTGDDDRAFRKAMRRLAPFRDEVRVFPRFDRAGRVGFLRGLTVLSVPGEGEPASALALLEAMAAGVPVVQPARGAYAEVVGSTGGGLLYDPADPGALAATLGRVLLDPSLARELGARGRAAVLRTHTVAAMAEATERAYRAALEVSR